MKSREIISGRAPYLLFGIMGLALLATLFARWAAPTTSEEAREEVVASCELRFEDGPAGAVLVFDANGGALLSRFEAGSGSFVRGVLRSMVRERRSLETGPAEPFRLARHSDGALTIRDEATGRLIVLNAFGPTNAGVFASLLDASLTGS